MSLPQSSMKLKYYINIVLIISCLNSFGQTEPTKKDSVSVYEKLENYSKKRKATKFLHKLIFRSSKKKSSNQRPQIKKQDFSPFEGKIIRSISIKTHDPFGFSFTDSTERANSWIEKTGNNIHIKTKQHVIRDLLLIEKGEPLDILKVDESARLIRSQNYIRSVEITAKNVENAADSVDVFVTVLDSWSLIPRASVSTSKTSIKLKDRNFLGFGHQFDNSITNRMDDGKTGYNISYTVPNWKNTYINSSIGYNIDLNGFYVKRFHTERPFYSPLTRWAGGVYLDEVYRKEWLLDENDILGEQNFKYQSQDIWAGHSFEIFDGNTEKERTSHLISSVRLLNLNYEESPSASYDSIGYFSSETFYMGSIGLASRQFVQDSYIFRDGIVEDVPIGTVIATMAGYQRKNKRDRLYLGAKISHGNYFSWGYLSTNLEYGTFLHNKEREQTTYSIQANYFTNLIPLGEKWKMRQFIKPHFVIGTNRLNSVGDRLTLNENNRFPGVYGNESQRLNSAGIPGFDSDLLGTKKFVLSFQSQFYSPWEVLGFRLNPYINITSALLGDEGVNISKNKLYSAFGLGCIIRNDYLVFGAFQISISYYPSIPGNGNHVFNSNSFSTEDFGFQDFQLGKPTPVWYN